MTRVRGTEMLHAVDGDWALRHLIHGDALPHCLPDDRAEGTALQLPKSAIYLLAARARRRCQYRSDQDVDRKCLILSVVEADRDDQKGKIR
jgi:hypothetical protein